MRSVVIPAFVLALMSGPAFGQSCETKALSKDGKPLFGAAKASFMKKCKKETCETKAVGSDGERLAGAARNSFLKKCESEA